MTLHFEDSGKLSHLALGFQTPRDLIPLPERDFATVMPWTFEKLKAEAVCTTSPRKHKWER